MNFKIKEFYYLLLPHFKHASSIAFALMCVGFWLSDYYFTKRNISYAGMWGFVGIVFGAAVLYKKPREASKEKLLDKNQFQQVNAPYCFPSGVTPEELKKYTVEVGRQIQAYRLPTYWPAMFLLMLGALFLGLGFWSVIFPAVSMNATIALLAVGAIFVGTGFLKSYKAQDPSLIALQKKVDALDPFYDRKKGAQFVEEIYSRIQAGNKPPQTSAVQPLPVNDIQAPGSMEKRGFVLREVVIKPE